MIYSSMHLLQVLILISSTGGALMWMIKEWPQIKDAVSRDYPVESQLTEAEQIEKEYEIAEQDFQYADPELAEAAIYRLKAAEIKRAVITGREITERNFKWLKKAV